MWAIGLLKEVEGGGGLNWLLWVAFGFFALMVLVGWLSSRRKKGAPESDQQHTNELIEHH